MIYCRNILKPVNLLTIEESFRLKRKVQELTDRQDEITLMKLSHKKEMEEMRSRLNHNNEQLDRIISIIQENPKVKVKVEVLCHMIEIGCMFRVARTFPEHLSTDCFQVKKYSISILKYSWHYC